MTNLIRKCYDLRNIDERYTLVKYGQSAGNITRSNWQFN